MAIDFTVKDVIHKIAVKFIHAFLPDAQKPYYLKAAVVPALEANRSYRLMIITQSSAKHSGTLLKETRRIQSEFTLAAH